ncbi:hypothetical protein H0I39_04100 [Ottowia beijingensis]|uniref:Uncharacterized protein n=2 Tax=Ottowia beijingensis TaxID=1207057 RepID=A0A853ITU1_9BURK|nr:hypothetical protein [Ottowia beijingensis]NZA01151.1 hypothetical protein [Ottowia beijingensis]
MPIVENRRFQSRPRKKGDAGVTDSVALRLANLNFERSDPDELETTADQDAVQLIYRIVSFMKALKNTDEELFRIDLDTRGRRHYYQHPLGESFIRLCGRPMLPIVEAFPLHELNPWVKAF